MLHYKSKKKNRSKEYDELSITIQFYSRLKPHDLIRYRFLFMFIQGGLK